MHRRLRELLPEAAGKHEWVAAINADIRGFSSVMSGDPAQTGLYLKRVYQQILDNYFVEASFFKPTGDGLLLVVPFETSEVELARVTKAIVNDALRLNSDFAKIVNDDKLIKFPHPRAIGIGLSVGSVSRLVAKRQTLDYTGRSLNVASRLMELARPSGVVFDMTLDASALSKTVARRFASDHVYLKGVAEEDGLDIFYTQPETSIPEQYRKPIRPYALHSEEEDDFTRAEAGRRGRNFIMRLSREPADRTQITVKVIYKRYIGGKPEPGLSRRWDPPWKYELDLGRPTLRINFHAIEAHLIGAKVPARAGARLEVRFPVSPE